MKDENRGCLIKENTIVTFELPTPEEYEKSFRAPKYNKYFNRSKFQKKSNKILIGIYF